VLDVEFTSKEEDYISKFLNSRESPFSDVNLNTINYPNVREFVMELDKLNVMEKASKF
jgi:hypothetical protein